ncbi:MAG: DUF1684 domain-containing protein [Euzebyales bacterium]|jgi:uncharacterized protein (DUF1684 family)|nr:DUF1684 domain-containing protein [Euzebyales bacterium]
MSATLELAGWRRSVADLYAGVRATRDRDPQGAHARWRQGRDALFRAHPQSPLGPAARERFAGLRYLPYDPELAFTVPVDTDVTEETHEIAASTGPSLAFCRVGRVHLPVGDLDVFWLDAYGGGLFLPFRDATAGEETYGGGRYLLDTVKGADLGATVDGRLVCDFNFAYHPSCHYDPAWSCPLAPAGSHLEERIEAGEQSWDA